MSVQYPQIAGENPYRVNVQGKVNEPICIAALLDRAQQTLDEEVDATWSLEMIYDRLDNNAPRIAIVGGSWDHPAHIGDLQTVSRAALRIWQNGGVPFYFALPVMCDGTAQSTQGMSYSLQSRNALTQMVVNQLEAQCYHGAFVIQSCDKQPLAMVAAMAHLDRVRQERGDAPFFATFAPSHVLRGGVVPADVQQKLTALVVKARQQGATEIAEDLEDTMGYILQCTTNTAFQGVLTRAKEKGIISQSEHQYYEKQLAVASCHKDGGICAFNGTGNSSRHLVCGLGFVHPHLEFLTGFGEPAAIDAALDALAPLMNQSSYGAARILQANINNAIRVHSASGGSTNLVMHLVAAMIYAGFRFDLHSLACVLNAHPVPDLFDFSLTDERDIFVLAQQCSDKQIRGMETLVYELVNNGVPMDLHAPTMSGQTWAERIANERGLSATGVTENRIILDKPRRAISGVKVLAGNFFDTAVVKISGMPDVQVDAFQDKLSLVLYYENEEEANQNLLDTKLLDSLRIRRAFSFENLQRVLQHNQPASSLEQTMDYDQLFVHMVQEGILKLSIVISGQGPKAYGMPEMFTPMQHINANRQLQRLTTLLSDGRYSGVTYGAAIGHMTPEAIEGGGILYLQTGDLLELDLRGGQINWVTTADFHAVFQERQDLGTKRLEQLRRRQRRIAAANRMVDCTDAAQGVVPHLVFEEATRLL